VRWCRDGNFLHHFCVLYFQRVACSTFQTCILNSQSGHTMCGSMVDIHSATAEIRQGKKKEERRKKQDKNIMSTSAMQGGHNYSCAYHYAQLSYTIQHRTVLIIFPPILPTIVIAQMMSTGGEGAYGP